MGNLKDTHPQSCLSSLLSNVHPKSLQYNEANERFPSYIAIPQNPIQERHPVKMWSPGPLLTTYSPF